MKFKNIKTKLLFWYSIMIVGILSVFSFVLLHQFYKQGIQTVDKQLTTVINEINYNQQFYTPFDNEEFMIQNLYIAIYKYKNGKFNKVISSKSTSSINNMPILTKGQFEFFTTTNNVRVAIFHSNKEEGNIYIEAGTTLNDKINSSLEHLKSILDILIPLLLIFSMLVGYLIIRNSLSPVKKIMDEVKDIEGYQLQKRIKSYTKNDEIEELVITFNFMLDKLDESFSKIRRFSNDVSHELKTPLTVIRGEIELGLRKERDNEEYKEILNSVLEETKLLQELINSLLFLSKANNQEMKSKFEEIELDEIVTDIISQNKKLIEEKDIVFKFLSLDSVSCQGHPLLLRILVGNIVQNAIKYSHKHSTVEIYLDKDTLKIKDYGIGIQETDLENIFDRFYRVDASRGRGGYGLGLSIVKSIAVIHNFEVSVQSEYNNYTQFSVKL